MAPRWLSFTLFFAVTTTLWTLTTLYLSTQVVRGLGFGRRAAFHARLWFVAVSFMYVFGRLLGYVGVAPGLAGALTVAGAYWVGGISLALALFAPAELGLLIWRVAGFPRAATRKSALKLRSYLLAPHPRSLTVCLLACLGAACAAALVIGHADPVVNRITMVAPPGCALTRPITLVHMTDLHLSRIIGAQETARFVDIAQELNPDAVVLTGDILDETSEHVEEALKSLERLKPPLGTFAVTGNHEMHVGHDYFIRKMEQIGITVLAQEHLRPAAGLVLAGVDDPRVLRRDGKLTTLAAMSKALSGVRPDDFTVLLTHRPLEIEEAGRLGADLVLAGHTHGGQVPPFQLLTPLFNDGFLHGRYEVGSATLYVGAGTGTWGPRMRLFSRSEIVHITILPASDRN